MPLHSRRQRKRQQIQRAAEEAAVKQAQEEAAAAAATAAAAAAKRVKEVKEEEAAAAAAQKAAQEEAAAGLRKSTQPLRRRRSRDRAQPPWSTGKAMPVTARQRLTSIPRCHEALPTCRPMQEEEGRGCDGLEGLVSRSGVRFLEPRDVSVTSTRADTFRAGEKT